MAKCCMGGCGNVNCDHCGIKKTQEEKNIMIELLEDYTNFLLKEGYCDADVYAEEPKAIDKYMKKYK